MAGYGWRSLLYEGLDGQNAECYQDTEKENADLDADCRVFSFMVLVVAHVKYPSCWFRSQLSCKELYVILRVWQGCLFPLGFLGGLLPFNDLLNHLFHVASEFRVGDRRDPG